MKKIIATVILFSGILLITACGGRVQEMYPQPIYNPNDLNEVTSFYSDIFVAKIEKLKEVREYDGTGLKMPYTSYELKVYHTLKGNQNTTENMIYFGGIDKKGNTYKYAGVPLPVVGEVYIFLPKRAERENSRYDIRDFLVSYPDAEMILLNDYDTNKELVQQSSSILNTVAVYEKAILNNKQYIIPA